MYTCMCNWVPVLYSGKKNVLGEITIKNKLKTKSEKQGNQRSKPNITFTKTENKSTQA